MDSQNMKVLSFINMEKNVNEIFSIFSYTFKLETNSLKKHLCLRIIYKICSFY
jgi:hypothetical protein